MDFGGRVTQSGRVTFGEKVTFWCELTLGESVCLQTLSSELLLSVLSLTWCARDSFAGMNWAARDPVASL